ncbi:hypothetical protein A2721_03165 [Candidatus Gottesmanbacteria bacterium RIFCSPHIGHO2_01_FULL_47_48]|uniref:Antitoxin n=1 Tax=Candidatus Gottesmanbacteria bacterium RIFCSPHIGHO2_01_FULL_47_48 TaxID=1798381 RepID=A0A1F6A054_9BACT|nr:MAG: hypothetical protein A2721_03165 [Candidatus Gottesmanbacteria bacterium RIFCSPHIGHO2_01_FULL_47_48]
MIRPKIVSNPKILRGKPIISGTRISVELIMDLLSANLTTDQIIKEYPHLTKESVLAAINFAKNAVQKEEIHPIVKKGDEIIFLSERGFAILKWCH